MLKLSRFDELVRDRLERYLRIKIGVRGIKLEYTDQQTSYFDGKKLYVIFNVNREPHLIFDNVEKEMVQKAHALHEGGHFLYDHLPSYTGWLESNRLQPREDYKDFAIHKHIPISYLQMFGNCSLDGRMETLLSVNFAESEVPALLDYCNYEWAYPACFLEAERGMKKLEDFREMFPRRCLGMTDLDWHEDVVALVNDHQPIMDAFLKQPSTEKCLEGVFQYIEAVWPTILEWIEEEKEDVPENQDAFSEDMFNQDSQWNDDKELAEQMAQQLMDQLTEQISQESMSESGEGSETSQNASEGEESSDGGTGSKNESNPSNEQSEQEEKQSDGKKSKKEIDPELLEALKEEIQQAQEAIEELINQEEADKQGKPETVKSATANFKSEGVAIIRAPEKEDISVYNQAAQKSIRQVVQLSNVLESILAEEKNSRLKGTNRGRLMINRVWQGVHCDNPNIREYRKDGVPAGNAVIEFMTDISGSTCGTVIDTIKESLSLFLLAADRAKVPTKAFAFNTTATKTHIYKIKPNPFVFDNTDKGRIGGLSSGFSNRDVVALQYLLDDISAFDAEIKLAVMISDGAPIFDTMESEEMVSEMVKAYEKKGIDVLCLFVGDDMDGLECAKRMYGPNRVVHAKERLIDVMRRSITRILANRRDC